MVLSYHQPATSNLMSTENFPQNTTVGYSYLHCSVWKSNGHLIVFEIYPDPLREILVAP